MRAHSILALVVMSGLAAACAGESADMARQVALPGDASTGDAVASAIEVGEQVESAPVQRAVRAAAAPSASVEAEDNAGSAPAVPEIQAYVVSSAARLQAPVVTVSRPAAAVATVDEPSDEPAPAIGDDGAFRPRPGVIIRGGVTEDDDCKLHMPGNGRLMTPPRAGALVNQRGPRLGLPAIRGGGIR
ncbi:hypothetical protein BH23GEM10_BH23GEM10_00730 [soil metagenome]